jgi:hypothetical protein
MFEDLTSFDFLSVCSPGIYPSFITIISVVAKREEVNFYSLA